jgi:hypothetical protein
MKYMHRITATNCRYAMRCTILDNYVCAEQQKKEAQLVGMFTGPNIHCTIKGG